VGDFFGFSEKRKSFSTFFSPFRPLTSISTLFSHPMWDLICFSYVEWDFFSSEPWCVDDWL
jgi:hypothetical protein